MWVEKAAEFIVFQFFAYFSMLEWRRVEFTGGAAGNLSGTYGTQKKRDPDGRTYSDTFIRSYRMGKTLLLHLDQFQKMHCLWASCTSYGFCHFTIFLPKP